MRKGNFLKYKNQHFFYKNEVDFEKPYRMIIAKNISKDLEGMFGGKNLIKFA